MSDVPGFSNGGREPRFDHDAEIGFQGELFYENVVEAIRDGTAEVKTDERAAVTGRVFIEYCCRLHDGWMSSGIGSTESALWVHIIGQRIALVVPVDLLRPVCRVARDEGRVAPGGTAGGNPTKGVVIPLHLLVARLLDEARRRLVA